MQIKNVGGICKNIWQLIKYILFLYTEKRQQHNLSNHVVQWYCLCWPHDTFACLSVIFYSRFNNESTPREVHTVYKKGWLKQRTVDREIVKVSEYQDTVLLVLPIFSNVSQNKHKNVVFHQIRIQNHVKHLRRRFLQKNSQRLSAVNYFCKNLHFRCLTVFWMRLWLGNALLNAPLRHAMGNKIRKVFR